MNLFKFLIFTFICTFIFPSCETVAPGNKGVEVSWGGETNMTKIYPEGFHGGIGWLFDELIEYDVRERTIVSDYEFNDVNNMVTGVEIAVDYNFHPEKVNVLHTKITDVEAKLEKTIKSAGKEVITNYGAVELNLTMRSEAEDKLAKILEKELPEFYLQFARVQITDVDIPKAISEQARKTAEQIEKNKLAAQMAEEKTNLGKAIVAEAKAKAESAVYDAKRLEAVTSPSMLKYKELEVQMEWAKKGVSPYGSNNVFGGNQNLLLNRNN